MTMAHTPHKRLVLLVEPGYRSKYPPLGLMKISQYHKQKGDHVEFVKGLSPDKRDKVNWDRIYVSSLFTYHWSHTIKALRYYRPSVKPPSSANLVVGGPMATLMADDIRQAVDCRVVTQLADERGKLGYDDDEVIDSILPDYGILEEVDYSYPASNAYIVHTTRGCVRRCQFCAVPRLEPHFNHYVPLGDQIEEISRRYGPKRDLLLLDNNVLASSEFKRIIEDIKAVGFEKGARFTYTSKSGRRTEVRRRVDFNQGVDIRLLTRAKMRLLSQISLEPLRLAFDNFALKDLYDKKVRLAAKFGINRLSNYLLFNYDDKPEDLYRRLRVNIELNEELGLQIFSFPMRYVSLTSKDRRADTSGNIGTHWNKKYLRAIRCILIPTRGIVGARKDFFEAAFGRDVAEFQKILLMPEDYIINRRAHQKDGSTDLWWQQLNDLSRLEKEALLGLVLNQDVRCVDRAGLSTRVGKVLGHYARPPDK